MRYPGVLTVFLLVIRRLQLTLVGVIPGPSIPGAQLETPAMTEPITESSYAIDRKETSDKCSCGAGYGIDGSRSGASSPPRAPAIDERNFFDSFVHLPVHVIEPPLASSEMQQVNAGKSEYLKSLAFLKLLERATNDAQDPPRLCIECVKRVERALIASTERMTQEMQDIYDATRGEELTAENFKRALQVASNVEDDGFPQTIDVAADRRREALQLEIQELEEACREHELEIARLLSIQRDQAHVMRQLDELESAMDDEQNALELQGRAFNNDQELLSHALAGAQSQVQRLSSNQIRLLGVMFRIQIDKERGLRYPLINELRLAYRPKGDVNSKEIQAAWSLAAQLLLAIATLFRFKSQHWKIVPLSSCAKLIYQPLSKKKSSDSECANKREFEVFNLGVRSEESRALIAWNRLLHQIVRHVIVESHEASESGLIQSTDMPVLPYEVSHEKIGDIVLSLLHESDDAKWSRVIHYNACILEWLCQCASVFMLQNVLLLTDLANYN